MRGRVFLRRCTAATVMLIAVGCTKSAGTGDDSAASPGPSVTGGTSLVGPRWRLVELEGQPSIAGGGTREPNLQFAADNKVTGATGCNSMGGTYEASGATVRFSQIFSTKMACVEENRMQQETRFLRVLERADRYAVSGDTLTLSEGDTVLARLVKS
jgi:heat shock protein HslJ